MVCASWYFFKKKCDFTQKGWNTLILWYSHCFRSSSIWFKKFIMLIAYWFLTTLSAVNAARLFFSSLIIVRYTITHLYKFFTCSYHLSKKVITLYVHSASLFTLHLSPLRLWGEDLFDSFTFALHLQPQW